MNKINFQNLPDTTTPVNATNLNAVQTNAENAINLKVDITKEHLSLNDATTFADIVSGVVNNRNKICNGQIGDQHSTSIKTLLGNPNIGNYTTVVFELMIDYGNGSEGSIRATAYAPFTTNVVVGYLNYGGGGSYEWTGWTH